MRPIGIVGLAVVLLLGAGMGIGQTEGAPDEGRERDKRADGPFAIAGAEQPMTSLTAPRVRRAPENDADGHFDVPARVTRVKDGDTFVAQWPDGHREDVRPAGWDAPELFRSSPECFAAEAMLHAVALLSGQTIWLSRADERRDRYGRLLAVVYLDSARTARVGTIMVSQGFAEVADFPAGTELEPLLAEAQEAERGLWGQCPYADVSE